MRKWGLPLAPTDLHLTGIITERGYLGAGHWLMFLFEVKTAVEVHAAAASRGDVQIFFARGIGVAENAGNGRGTNLADVLEASRRIFRGLLRLPGGWNKPMDD
jgi:hypothetical protein